MVCAEHNVTQFEAHNISEEVQMEAQDLGEEGTFLCIEKKGELTNLNTLLERVLQCKERKAQYAKKSLVNFTYFSTVLQRKGSSAQ